MRLALVINRSAGSFRRLPLDATVQSVVQALRDCGHDVQTEICGRHDLVGIMTDLAQDDHVDAVLVGGGDGTIQTAILSGLGQAKPLGIIPLGTLNLLARDLNLPADPVQAALAVGRGQVTPIDLAQVNGLPFAIWASLGMHPWIVRRRDRLQKGGYRKWPAFILAALRAFRRYPMIRVTLSSQGKTTTVTTPLVVISNNAWREQPLPLVRESLDRGELVVHVARATSRLGMVWLALQAMLGLWKTSRLMECFTADNVRVIGRKRRMMVSLDGEVTVLRSPLNFVINPKSLNMLMPNSNVMD